MIFPRESSKGKYLITLLKIIVDKKDESFDHSQVKNSLGLETWGLRGQTYNNPLVIKYIYI